MVDDRNAAAGADPDATVADSDATVVTPADATSRLPPSDATTRLPASDATRRVTPLIWAARVQVPPEDVAPVREPVPVEWQPATGSRSGDTGADGDGADDGAGGSRLRPMMIPLIVVVLLAMLGTGLWLIFNRSSNGTGLTPTPIASTVASDTAAPTDTDLASETAAPTDTATATEAPSPTGVPTTVAPTTTQLPAPPPATPTAGLVAVPDVVGDPVTDAERQLTAKGLTYRVVGGRDGTVVTTRPRAGTMVARGTEVVLVVVGGTPSPSPDANAPATG
jgi:PASTA domain